MGSIGSLSLNRGSRPPESEIANSLICGLFAFGGDRNGQKPAQKQAGR